RRNAGVAPAPVGPEPARHVDGHPAVALRRRAANSRTPTRARTRQAPTAAAPGLGLDLGPLIAMAFAEAEHRSGAAAKLMLAAGVEAHGGEQRGVFGGEGDEGVLHRVASFTACCRAL